MHTLPWTTRTRNAARLAVGAALATVTLAVGLPAVAGPAEGGAEGTPACARALAEVDAREAAVRAARRQDPDAAGRPDPRLLAARRRAARACLGPEAEVSAADRPGAATPSRRPPATRGPAPPAPPVWQGAMPPPAAGAGVAVSPGPVHRRATPAARADGVTPGAPPAPLTVAACDPGGCWASDGTRLQRVGPQLVGPRGFCTQQGAWLHCP